MNRLVLFKKSLEEASALYRRCPNFFPLLSAINQLEFLIDFEQGNENFEKLKTIDIGLLAAREIESFDEGLAELLHQVSSEVRDMLSGR
ncbi:immunity protein Tsi6 family protein [Limnobacter sp.]|uniref:immunity protein Tsi6 family protein n=1 Tax=Limnobacter sp. TaxID=2003368 RepID=UPI00258ED944|nr:immunity protein Tsi6 family protein [Limnobacter sp.]